MGRRMKLLGIEGGGTTWIARAIEIDVEGGASVSSASSARGEEHFNKRDGGREQRFETTTPEETLRTIREWIEINAWDADAIGVATFGPLELNPDKDKYGYITTTPKAGVARRRRLGQSVREKGRDGGGGKGVARTRSIAHDRSGAFGV